MAEKKNLFVPIVVAPRSRGSKVPVWASRPRACAVPDVEKLAAVMARQPGFICDPVHSVSTRSDMDRCLQSLVSRHGEYADLFVFISAYTVFIKCSSKPHLIFCRDNFYNLRGKIHEYFSSQIPGVVSKIKWFFIQGCCPSKYGTEGSDGSEDEPDVLPAEANISIYWSEVPGSDIPMDDNGSATVHHFCEVVNTLQSPTNLALIFPMVNTLVSRELARAELPILLPETETTGTGAIILRQTASN